VSRVCPVQGLSCPGFVVSRVCLSRVCLSRVECLREFESICKTVLAHESGDPGVQFNEKTEGRKSRYTVPLSRSMLSAII
jgi:hypothetical protein